ncbi:MAG: flavodoxin domain-containing protein [Streptococcaceae bacterium]|jgi:menaquinone-dependent protoporphyrinogen IX oxidase|nr:flavodoxin domain-containing protein [Streptococcaceae bacterium]
MNNALIIYQSTYGTTKKYAQWLAAELQVSCIEIKDIKAEKLSQYNLVIYGGSIRAGKISGIATVLKAELKHLVVFTVGLADPKEVDFKATMNRSFPKSMSEPEAVFHFRGGIDYSKLKLGHRMLLQMLKKAVEKKLEKEWTAEEKAIIETYGKTIDFSQQEAIQPLVTYVKENYS